MMKKNVTTAVCAAALMMALPLAADAEEGNWYAGIEGAYSLLGTQKGQGSDSGLDVRQDFKDGWAAGLKGGYDFGRVRVEGELGYHRHGLDQLTVLNSGGVGLASGDGSGTASLKTALLNMVYDFDATGRAFQPFIGAGLGIGDMDWSGLRAGGVDYIASSDTVFAYQAFAGVRTALSEAVDLMAKYRYMATSDAGFDAVGGGTFDADYDVHDFVVGLTYRFGGSRRSAASEMPQPVARYDEPEPVVVPETDPMPESEPEPVSAMEEVVPVPDPLPEPAAGPQVNMGPYVVYFGLDSTDLDFAARTTIEEAADAARQAGEVRVLVDGYADRSGAASYNDNLARQRAQAVKTALEAEGVAAEQIMIDSHGERDNAVLTEDGVVEAQNRRVTILLK